MYFYYPHVSDKETVAREVKFRLCKVNQELSQVQCDSKALPNCYTVLVSSSLC